MRRLAIAVAAAVALALAPGARAGGVPVQLAVSGSTLWATSDVGLCVLDARTGRVLRRPRTTYPYAMWVAAGGGDVWVGSITNGYLAGALDRFDADGRRIAATRTSDGAVYGVAYGAGRAWTVFVRNGDTVVRGGARPVILPGPPGWVAADAYGLWSASGAGLWLVEPSGVPARIAGAPPSTSPVAVGDGSVWEIAGHRVLRFDSARRTLISTESFAGSPLLVAAGAGREWVALARGDRGELVLRGGRSRVLPFSPTDLLYARSRLWAGRVDPAAVVELDPKTLRTVRTIPLC